MDVVRRWLSRLSRLTVNEPTENVSVPVAQNVSGEPASDDQFPQWPPPPPAEIIANRGDYHRLVRERKYEAPRGVFDNSPLAAFYRLYELFALDYVYGYRNELEWFWREASWAVEDIPDPQDSDPARYAFLASMCAILVRSFNTKLKIGARRDGPRIMSSEQCEEMQSTPESEKRYEKVPKWAEAVSPLEQPLIVPSHDGVVMTGPDDERADPDFKTKNILVWGYHIHFT